MSNKPKITFYYESEDEHLDPDWAGWNYLIEGDKSRWTSGPFRKLKDAIEDFEDNQLGEIEE